MSESAGADWEIMWFQEAQADVRWAKERSWSITYAAVVLIAAVYAVAERLSERPLLFAIAATAVSLGAMAWITDLSRFAARSRSYVDATLIRVVAGDLGYPKRPDKDPDHTLHLIGQLGVLAAASACVSVLLHDSLGLLPGAVAVTPLIAVPALSIYARLESNARGLAQNTISVEERDQRRDLDSSDGSNALPLSCGDDA